MRDLLEVTQQIEYKILAGALHISSQLFPDLHDPG